MTADARFEPERIVAALNAAGVRYVIVGGLAAGAHSVVRATPDLDLVPDPEPANADRLASALHQIGGEPPIGGSLTGGSPSLPASMKIMTTCGEIQVLQRMPGTAPFHELAAERLLVEIDVDVLAPVCSLRHLRRMKRASTRPRDAVDLAELDELHGAE